MIEDELKLLKQLRQKTGKAVFKSEAETKIGEKIAQVLKELDEISGKTILTGNELPKTENQLSKFPEQSQVTEDSDNSGFCSKLTEKVEDQCFTRNNSLVLTGMTIKDNNCQVRSEVKQDNVCLAKTIN